MEKKLFLIEYEGSQWCGGKSHCVVLAENEIDAEDLAADFMDESMRELFSSEYDEDAEEGGSAEEEQAYMVISVEEFGPTSEEWKWFIDEDQRQFFPCVNFAFEDVVK